MISQGLKNVCKYLRRSMYGYRKPEIFINLTYSCPLRCKFCYVNYSRNRDFDEESISYLFEECILKLPFIKLVTFFGGEPLLKLDLIQMVVEKYYDQLVKQGIHVAVITSMSVNVDKYMNLIKKYPLFETVISFDNYSEQRVYANSKPFKVLEHIDMNVVKELRRNMCFHTVIDSPESLDDIMLLQSLYKEYGVIYSWCWNKTPTKVFEFKEKYKEVVKNILKEDSYYPKVFLQELSAYYHKDSVGCGVGSEFFLSADGDLSPCSISHHNNEFLLVKQGIVKDDVPELIENLEKNVFNNDSCKDCNLKGFCNGGCLFERKKNRNDYRSVNPVQCALMKSLYETYDELVKDNILIINDKLENIMMNEFMGNVDYCYNNKVNIDMYDYFEIGEK